MLTSQQLRELVSSLGSRQVLSVYLDGHADDPLLRDVWSKVLDLELSRIRAAVPADERAERAELTRCIALLDAETNRLRQGIGAPGWAAFITAEGVVYAEPQAVPMPTLVAWRRGVLVAPYLRALKEDTPAFIAVTDDERADVYRYLRGRLTSVGHTRSPAELDAVLLSKAEGDAWIVIGGAEGGARRAFASLPDCLARRALLTTNLARNATPYEIAAAAALGASTLRRARDSQYVDAMLELSSVAARAVTGLQATREAVDAGAARELMLTRHFIERQPDDAEDVVRAASGEDATIEVVSGEAAELLDDRGEGIGALLRVAASV
ncbi:MAG TPA: hypothetical protein VHM30_19565 [Gemmatimonadaceae bacterium]|nr:hypothetical protein [Gemmatimonadaceae bacterium]